MPRDILAACKDLHDLAPCAETLELGKRLSCVDTSDGLRYSECSTFDFMKTMKLPSLASMYSSTEKKVPIKKKWYRDSLCSICHEKLSEHDAHKQITCDCRTRVIHEKCMGRSSHKKCPCCEINLIIKDIKNVI